MQGFCDSDWQLEDLQETAGITYLLFFFFFKLGLLSDILASLLT